MKEGTETQKNRLTELNADAQELVQVFEDETLRNKTFQTLVTALVKTQKIKLGKMRDNERRPGLCRLADQLVDTLTGKGFVQVTTPTMMAKNLLGKMSITDSHPLTKQIFWVDSNRCLRPMLAPHLYYIMKDLLRIWEKPIGIFEIGSCFRKESEGARHTSEFTMLNVCEFGLPMEERHARLEELAELVMKTCGIDDYKLEAEESAVYGSTIDVVGVDPEDLELGSGAMGPHPLDDAWKINETWVGIGFGIERLLMARDKSNTLGKYTRSLTWLDGVRLNL
ncbi:MAG: pyrrolysine--tRNA(Pyl) ligase large subunit [Desulfobacula sp.]|jgi:pyrrolysyl-tRNA synthetase-like protein|nr:pyrrolysine--tRNA(Pyl) ligase large subunit [Desulfobacula sp.]